MMLVESTPQSIFELFCVNEGINHEVTSPYTSRHNGLAERRNICILNMDINMIKHENMPHMLWGKTFNETNLYIEQVFHQEDGNESV